jgi:hypothetical protein
MPSLSEIQTLPSEAKWAVAASVVSFAVARVYQPEIQRRVLQWQELQFEQSSAFDKELLPSVSPTHFKLLRDASGDLDLLRVTIGKTLDIPAKDQNNTCFWNCIVTCSYLSHSFEPDPKQQLSFTRYFARVFQLAHTECHSANSQNSHELSHINACDPIQLRNRILRKSKHRFFSISSKPEPFGVEAEIQQQLTQTERTDEIRRRQKSVGMARNFWGAIEKVYAVGTSPLGLVGAEGQVVLATILLTTCLVALIEWQLSADASILIPVMAAVAAGFSLLDHILLKIQIQRQPRRN